MGLIASVLCGKRRTQREVAEVAGVTEVTITSLERMTRILTAVDAKANPVNCPSLRELSVPAIEHESIIELAMACKARGINLTAGKVKAANEPTVASAAYQA